MAQFSPEQRAAILAESFETLARLERLEGSPANSSPGASWPPLDEEILQQALAQPLETRNQRDRRELEEHQERRAMQRDRLRDNEARFVRRAAAMDAATQAGWDSWLKGHVDRALAERDQYWREVHVQVLAEERHKTDAKLAGLELKIDALAAELNKQRAVADGSIADLLPPVPRRRNAAA